MASRGTPEQAGAGRGKQGHVGAGCGKLGQVGAGWAKFELENCSHCFFFVAYVRMLEIDKKGKVDWSKIDGSSSKLKWLHLGKDETDSLYHCPIQVSDHDGFKSQRGRRKHVNTKHS